MTLLHEDLLKKGRVCSTAVEHSPHYLEVVGLNPAGCCLCLFLLSFTSGVSCIRSLKEVHLYLCVVNAIKIGCLAMLPGTKQTQLAQIA